jgi:lipopolysaccharide/colanic/teichoic acid biosynthesis glycosyltransferase
VTIDARSPHESQSLMTEANAQPEPSAASIPSSASEALYEASDIREVHRGVVGRFLKRTLDIGVSLVGLIVLSPLLGLAIIAIRLNSRGDSFFRMDRVGLRGGHFTPLKFRTMVNDAVSKGTGYQVSRHDNRITFVGNLLRNLSLDEVPQLINVLSGKMSLVGPRPSWPYQIARYDSEQVGRLRVRPGITGYAAVHGRNAISWRKRIEMDNWYIEHWSFWLDLKILAITPWKIMTREGIYGQGGVNEDV